MQNLETMQVLLDPTADKLYITTLLEMVHLFALSVLLHSTNLEF